MNRATILQGLADLVLLLHVLFVVFVVGGLFLIFLGGVRKWRWVRKPWFRLAHILAIGVVVVQSWFAVICPLTTTRKRLAGASRWHGVRRQLYCALVAGHSLLQRAGLGVCRLLHGFWGAGISKLGYSPAHALQQAK